MPRWTPSKSSFQFFICGKIQVLTPVKKLNWMEKDILKSPIS